MDEKNLEILSLVWVIGVGLIWVWFSPFSSFVDFGILSLIIGDLCFAIFEIKIFTVRKNFRNFSLDDFLGF